MLPVTAWPPVRPGYWTSPFGEPVEVDPSRHRHGFPLPKGLWWVRTGANQVQWLIRAKDPMEPYWRTPGVGIVHGMGRPPRIPTWPDQNWPSQGWPWAGGHRPVRPPQGPPPRPPCAPCPGPWPPPPGTVRSEVLVRPNSSGYVFSDGQNIRLFGAGRALVIKVFSA
jgi:hypothetical protein